MWKSLSFRNPSRCSRLQEQFPVFEPQHLVSVLNYASAAVFTKRLNCTVRVNGCLGSEWIKALVWMLFLFIRFRECSHNADMLTWRRRKKGKRNVVVPVFLPHSISLCFSLVYVQGFHGVWLYVCCNSYTAAPTSIIGLPLTVNPLMGHQSLHFPFCHCHFLFNPFTSRAASHLSPVSFAESPFSITCFCCPTTSSSLTGEKAFFLFLF